MRSLGLVLTAGALRAPRPFVHLCTCHRQLPQRRLYAVRSTPKANPEIFTAEHVPPLSWWEQSVDVLPEDLSPKDVFSTAGWYCQTARRGESTWKGKLQRDYGIDPYLLHWTALQLLQRDDDKVFILGVYMLETASDLGYAPSTVTLISIWLRIKDGFENPKQRRYIDRHLAAFNRLAAGGDNPDVLTVKGLLCLRRNNDDYDSALESFDAAIKTGSRAGDSFEPAPTRRDLGYLKARGPARDAQREARWSCEATCHVERGKILLRKGETTAARDAFSVAAYELDSALGYEELAKLLPIGSPERRRALLKLAVSGMDHVYRELEAYEMDRFLEASEGEGPEARTKGSGNVNGEYHMLMATEWKQLAEGEGARP